MADFCKYDDMYRDMLPECVRNRLDEIDPEALANLRLITGMEGAMIGVAENLTGNTVAVYGRELCIRILVRKYIKECPGKLADQAYMEAQEWLSYNVERALLYEGEFAPIIVAGFDCDREAWDMFKTEDGDGRPEK